MKKIVAFLLFSALVCTLQAQIKVGAERTEAYFPILQNKKVVVCGNQTSMVGNTHLVDTLVKSGIQVTAIFCPEHGFRGEAEAGATIHSSVDSKTGIPIVSLYGSNKKPKITPGSMDIILFDLQDVGCRFYTYISTLHYVMEAAAENGVKVIILDRPNPNGYFVDGPVLEDSYKSFVGMHPIPIVHGMTIGEYGKMINGEHWLNGGIHCDLQTITMEGYDHSMRYSLPIAPSPNLQTDEAIYLYPSLCLFEGTPISIGRGTATPFEIYGHPNLTEGEFYFTPQSIKGISENPPQEGVKCRGVNLTQTARNNLSKSNQFSITYLLEAYRHFPNKPSFFNSNNFFNKLAGNESLKQQIISGKNEAEIRKSWEPALHHFKEIRKQYLLYKDFE
ncbi:MAG: DUF1343 domain-containing protein [Bacteroidales bacterium]